MFMPESTSLFVTTSLHARLGWLEVCMISKRPSSSPPNYTPCAGRLSIIRQSFRDGDAERVGAARRAGYLVLNRHVRVSVVWAARWWCRADGRPYVAVLPRREHA